MSANEDINLESFECSQSINFPMPRSASTRKSLGLSLLEDFRLEIIQNRKNAEEELKTVVSEFRFEDVDSWGIFNFLTGLFQENRRLKPVKSKAPTALLKKQKKLCFLISILKAHDLGLKEGLNDSGLPEGNVHLGN